MDLIQLLPDSVANQIAAGEVIQRPASMVKELVENAVDAGASRIEVIAIDAGRTSLQVIDDGCGMSETDARLAFERHATSKIRQAADLFTLTTMGFRGEALPSIAAVAQVELLTRTAEQELGTHLILEGSRVVSQEPVACPVGANFLVKNLFFNVPARRKFLKSNNTELSNISSELERIVLVHPDIAFTLTSNGTTLLNLTPSSLKGRIAAVFGSRLADKLLTVEVQTPMITIHGFIGTPESSRKRGAQQYFFVNNRYMRHPYFHRAVLEAFSQLIPSDEQVPYFLYFDVNPAEIDVNIHPTKTEIKFENEQAIWQILLAAVREALGRFAAVPSIDFDTEGRPTDIPVFNPLDPSTSAPRQPVVQVDPTYDPFAPSSRSFDSASGHAVPSSGPAPFSSGSAIPSSHSSVPSGWESLYDGLSAASRSSVPSSGLVEGGFPALDPGGSAFDPDASTFATSSLAQYRGQYLLSSTEEGLLFIDQHRAHIRVLYDRYLAQSASSSLPSQRLLFPDVVKLSATDATTLAAVQSDLQSLGFDLSDLGGGTISILGIPSGLEGLDPQQLLQDLLAAAADRGTLPSEAVHGRLALALARAAAIPVGQLLSPVEQEDLLRQLAATTDPVHTPDGHIIQAVLPQDTIDRLFK
ncbi:MAG: DNA mismatch repair endonuclease MutL [Bacteroidaceae bacterium]|nr:DNA mismatch repair endonuclease MutL [Bacteroidaceae bacterium]MBR1790255.1 DNA mismatch repair endonuclease MutL [Bacteroidaceae bacterium]